MSSTQDPETERAAIDKAREGRQLLHAGDYEGAIAACTEAIELDPGILGAYGSRAAAYRRLGMKNEAGADLRYEAETKPAAIKKAREGARLLNAGDYWGAIAACTEAIRLDPRFDGAYLLRSEAYKRSDRLSPLDSIWEIPGYILRYLWWMMFDAPDSPADTRKDDEIPPAPRFEHLDQSKLAREYLKALSAPTATEMTESQCAVLSNLGIDARALEPAPGLVEGDEEPWGWIEIAEGPIRWVGEPPTDHLPPGLPIFLIPDSRIKSRYPRVALDSSLLGRAKRVQWYVNEYPSFEVGWFPIPLDNELSLHAADWLSQDAAIKEGMILSGVGLGIGTDLVRGCWILGASKMDPGFRTGS